MKTAASFVAGAVVFITAFAFSSTCIAATPLGMTDRTVAPATLAQEGMQWTRIITDARADRTEVAQQIRAAHDAGLKVVLTVGGIGTDDRFNNNPNGFEDSIAFIKRLPRVEYMSIENEPDLDGITACAYRHGWMRARKVFGKRLLFGEFSPHNPLTFMNAVVNHCGKLPKHLWVSIHPYQHTDPLAPPRQDSPWFEGGIGNLKKGKRLLKRNLGINVTWVPTEFGYCTRIQSTQQPMTDELAAKFWPRALKRFDDLKVPFAIIYVANGSTWRSSPFTG